MRRTPFLSWFSPFLLAALLLPALLLLALLPAAVQAQAAPAVTILADRLNVRSGPGTGYSVVASAVSGEKYNVVGQNGSCAWLQVAKGGRTLGWVSGSKSYTRFSGPCSSIPAVGGAAAPAAAPAGGAAKQGCALLTSQLAYAVKLGVARSDGWQANWSIPAGGQVKVCVDPGSYTATFTASGQTGSLAFPLTVKGGEYYEIPLNLPGN
jgi:N-acetylmuramoyl-L-alanine amidase